MILDNEQQKTFLLEMFKQVNFPGSVIDVAHSVLTAIRSSELLSKEKQDSSEQSDFLES
jgi:hypothetical protein